ncbi:hypothetical protein LMH87_010293 [Akanthomyces muscarius]|uniref:Uncharacterized protein n=1 Tax=Akanthomyces muscarius TaxID=2231603 RepID=A0A9W8UN26_AKAMU|nr:hypothetical protein LMH87_010293 [Akanthomyces muscarius]KAJ4153822.1 hypothetical protein LMH87_010293 [Akanthomyces muscarius]
METSTLKEKDVRASVKISRRDLESRFEDEKLCYQLSYHSVGCSDNRPDDSDASFCRYEAPEIAEHCQVNGYKSRLALAQAIPHDGMIALPFNFFYSAASGWKEYWKAIEEGQSSQGVAELWSIVYALEKIEAEWRGFNKYIDSLLVENFMNPRTYSKLLFDDASFSRSRLYFWILGCLNEFDVVIEDNIKQWTLYRQARVDKLLKRFARPATAFSSEKSPETPPGKAHGSLPTRRDPDKELKEFRELARKAEDIRQSLEDSRAHSKQSTSIARWPFQRQCPYGEQILHASGHECTAPYVREHILPPVGFLCGALGDSKHHRQQHAESFIVTAVLVGFSTYAIVFNLENIARLFGKVFFGRRSRLLQDMKKDPKFMWRQKRWQFEEFPSNEGLTRPSEWWLLWYQIVRLVRWKSLDDDE